MRTARSPLGARPARPRGAILLVAALTLTALLGLVALAVDLGVLAAARGQLKTVADSAALAGVRELASEARLSPSSASIGTLAQNAVTKAIAYGQSNSALGQAAVVLSGDVKVGSKSLPDPTDSTFVATTAPNTNSVQVTATRDGSHAGIVPAFFGGIFNATGWSPSVTSTATAEVFQIKGFNASGNQNAGIVPFVLDQATWNNLNTQNSDQYNYDPNARQVTSGPDGVYEVSMYTSNNGSGNFGTVDIGTSNNGTPNLGQQISQGISPSEMQAEFGSSQATLPHWFTSNTGISNQIKTELTNIIGSSRTLLLYDTWNAGTGNTRQYHVVAFVPIRIMNVDMTGNLKTVIVQPAYSTDPTAIPDFNNPGSWTSGGAIVLHLTR